MTKNSQAPKKCAHPEVKGLFLLAVALFLTLSWISFDGHIPANNWMGLIGYWLSFGLTYLFGLSSFCVIGFLFWAGWQLLSKEEIPSCTAKILYFSLCLFSANLLLNLVSELGCPFPTFLQNKVYSESIFFEQPYPHRYTRHNMEEPQSTFSIKTFLRSICKECLATSELPSLFPSLFYLRFYY